MKLKNFFVNFQNPWTLRVSGMGGYTSNCEKKSKSLHPTDQPLHPPPPPASTATVHREKGGGEEISNFFSVLFNPEMGGVKIQILPSPRLPLAAGGGGGF